jgi:PAS domain S-box-containing protein
MKQLKVHPLYIILAALCVAFSFLNSFAGWIVATCLACFMIGSLFYKKMQLPCFEPPQTEELYRSMITQANDCILIIDTVDFNVIEANTAFQKLLGYAPEEISSLNLYTFLVEDQTEISWIVQRILDETRCYLGEQKFRRKNDTILGVELNANIIYVGGRQLVCMFARDISDRKHYEGELRYKANHDPLTGLPNRMLFLTGLTRQFLSTSERKK